jgi:hypothetical protein
VSECFTPLRCDCHEQGEHWTLAYYDSGNHSSCDVDALTVLGASATFGRLISRRLKDQELTLGVKQHHELGKSLTPSRFTIYRLNTVHAMLMPALVMDIYVQVAYGKKYWNYKTSVSNLRPKEDWSRLGTLKVSFWST